MYFGDPRYGNNVVFELVANAIDQHLVGAVSQVDVTLDQQSISVKDDGPGLPFGRSSQVDPTLNEAEEYLQLPHFKATAKGHAPHVHIVPTGCGLAAVNAVCDRLFVSSDNGEELWTRTYERGLPVGDATVSVTNGKPGTEYHLALSEGIIGWPDYSTLKERLEQQAFLYPGLRISLNAEEFYASSGLLNLGISRGPAVADTGRQIWSQQKLQSFDMQIALVGDREDDCYTRTWVNGVEAVDGGSHLAGLDLALEKHGWSPAIKLLHVIMNEPKYAGPTKNRLEVPHMVALVEKAVTDLLNDENSSS